MINFSNIRQRRTVIIVINDKPTANAHRRVKSESLPPRSGVRGWLLSVLLFSAVPENHCRAVSQENKVRGTQIGEEESAC